MWRGVRTKMELQLRKENYLLIIVNTILSLGIAKAMIESEYLSIRMRILIALLWLIIACKVSIFTNFHKSDFDNKDFGSNGGITREKN